MNRLIAILFILSLTLASLAQSNNESPKPVTQEQATESQIINNKCFSLTMDNIIDILNIVVTAFLSLMAYRASDYANKLTKRQIKNDELLNMPDFDFQRSIYTTNNPDRPNDKNNSEEIKIYNVGGNITVSSTKCYSFLVLKSSNDIYKYPVNGFLNFSSIYNTIKGHLCTIFTLNSWGYYHDIYSKVLKYKKTHNDYVLADMERYIVIEYIDFKGEEHKDIFQNVRSRWIKVENIDYNMDEDEYEYKFKLKKIEDLANKSIDDLLDKNYIFKQV